MRTPEIIYEDGEILVMHKPVGMPSVGLPNGDGLPSLADWLIHYCVACKEASEKPTDGGLCHRLDTETSGLLIAAKTRKIFEHIRSQFSERAIEKNYLTLVEGRCVGDNRERAYFYNRHKRSKKISITTHDAHAPRNAQIGELYWKGLEYYKEHNDSLVQVALLSGVRHQIRAQLSHLGHPLVGDTLYGAQEREMPLFLHAFQLIFPHPVSKEKLHFEVLRDIPKER